jgi:hypothetical protein
VSEFELGETIGIPPSIIANALPTAVSNNLPNSPEDWGGVRLSLSPLLIQVLPNRSKSAWSIAIEGMDARVAIVAYLLTSLFDYRFFVLGKVQMHLTVPQQQQGPALSS